MFQGKKILIGISGGIAAYKTGSLIRALRKLNAEIKVVMTKAAKEFVTPLTFETLSENKVLTELFPSGHTTATIHIELARWADCFLICPATANIIAKLAHGIADDALTTIALASTVPLIFCPSMNKEMYANPFYQKNQEQLTNRGAILVEPELGQLACGEVGWGRLADEELILNVLKRELKGQDDLRDINVLVTAGRTEEAIDPVRFITNASSGKMGYAIAENAALRGANVTLISGPSSLVPFYGVDLVQVVSASQMAEAIKERIDGIDVLIMSAAVSDFRPKNQKKTKIKKENGIIDLSMEPTEDILLSLSKSKGDRIHIGFAVETENELTNAKKKLESKNLDLIVVNNPLQEGAGFGTDTNIVTIIKKNGDSIALPLMAKADIASKILDMVIRIRET